MKSHLIDDIYEIPVTASFGPAVSIILPFEPKMMAKSVIAASLATAADEVAAQLAIDYPGIGLLVLYKLNNIIASLNYTTFKKSLAIYVSPVFEKVLYLEMPVERKVTVSDSFEIRDLVTCKQQSHTYLVLLLDDGDCEMFSGNKEKLTRIITDHSIVVNSHSEDECNRSATVVIKACCENCQRAKFLRRIDATLEIIIRAYQLPLFVLGSADIIRQFRKLTRHGNAVTEYVSGDFSAHSEDTLIRMMQPHISDWKQVKEKDIVNRIASAREDKKLITGLKAVWSEAGRHSGSLLIMEKNFKYPAILQPELSRHVFHPEAISPFSHIKNAVDDVIEKVLENGGEVEFVDPGLLQLSEQITLILNQ